MTGPDETTIRATPPAGPRPAPPAIPLRYPGTAEAMHEHLHERLGGVAGIPDFILRERAALAVRINELKLALNAVILGHNYMEPTLYHSVPDFTGDSLALSRIAAETNADVIVFCGVRFMAETAKLLNPGCTVLLPSAEGGCSLAAGVTAEQVRRLKVKYPGAPVVAYVNTYAEVKAESDYCCTSGNAVAVIRALGAQGHDRIIFVPDEYLAANTAREAGFDFVLESPQTLDDSKAGLAARNGHGNGSHTGGLIIGWSARCEVHERFSVSDIREARLHHPDVIVLAHPECSPEVVAASDVSGSTSQMLRYVEEQSSDRPLLLLTECSMADNIAAACPAQPLVRSCSIRCPHMNEITLEQTLASLVEGRHVIDVPEPTASRARKAVSRMIA